MTRTPRTPTPDPRTQPRAGTPAMDLRERKPLGERFEFVMIVFCIGVVAGAILYAVGSTPPARDTNYETRLLVCAVLDELGADTVDPRIVEACPVP